MPPPTGRGTNAGDNLQAAPSITATKDATPGKKVHRSRHPAHHGKGQVWCGYAHRLATKPHWDIPIVHRTRRLNWSSRMVGSVPTGDSRGSGPLIPGSREFGRERACGCPVMGLGTETRWEGDRVAAWPWPGLGLVGGFARLVRWAEPGTDVQIDWKPAGWECI